MGQNEKKILDFSKGRYKEMLVWQRRLMWDEDANQRYAEWIDLTAGMTVVDVGCGLGYLGYSFWKYFGKGGHYIGVDLRPGLLEEAEGMAKSWASDGKADFIEGDVYNLPIEDNLADRVMCQTLMIHLEKPKLALSQMIRILKPGGTIFCIEPDNHRAALVKSFSSLPEYDLEMSLLAYKINLISHKGRIKLGRGDDGIAPRIPHLLNELGMDDIEVRLKEKVSYLEPPYKTELQLERINNMKRHWLSDESFEARIQEGKEEFLAGGGDINDFNKLIEIGKRQRKIQLQQMENNEFYMCPSYCVYLIKAQKPR